MGLTVDRDAGGWGEAGLEARKEWGECVGEMEGPRFLTCSVNLTLGPIATGSSQFFFFSRDWAQHWSRIPHKGVTHRARGFWIIMVMPGWETVLELELCRQGQLLLSGPERLRISSNWNSAGASITLGTEQIGKLDISSAGGLVLSHL